MFVTGCFKHWISSGQQRFLVRAICYLYTQSFSNKGFGLDALNLRFMYSRWSPIVKMYCHRPPSIVLGSGWVIVVPTTLLVTSDRSEAFSFV